MCMHTNVSILQTTGWPAIFFAAKNGKVDTFRKLLEWGARTELEVRDNWLASSPGPTPFFSM